MISRYNRKKMIKGIEVTVPMLLGKPPTPIEIHPKQGFYDYKTNTLREKRVYFASSTSGASHGGCAKIYQPKYIKLWEFAVIVELTLCF